MTEIRIRLLEAIETEDAAAFEAAVSSAFVADAVRDVADIFTAAIRMGWHQRHEDLASGLQVARYPGAVEALFETASARYEYLDYDEFFGLARKCTWALADIGTVAARARLRDLARSENSMIAGYAQKRLDRWEAELSRKRA